MASLPSSMTMYVEPLGEGGPYRPFGLHPLSAVAALYILLLLSSSCATVLGVDAGIVGVINILILVAPASLLVYCYSKPLNILRENKKWSDQLHAALRIELGKDAQLVNQTEFLIALRRNETISMTVYSGGKYKTYHTAFNNDEIVLFNMDNIDHDWALLNAEYGY